MDLTTRYMGLTLPNPLVASPTPLSNPRDGLHRLADGGVGAIVLFSRFEEQLREEALRNAHLAEAGAESVARRSTTYRRSPPGTSVRAVTSSCWSAPPPSSTCPRSPASTARR
jgi:dihydroorotate dehydrogenase (fumarate)